MEEDSAFCMKHMSVSIITLPTKKTPSHLSLSSGAIFMKLDLAPTTQRIFNGQELPTRLQI
jgi:hypothetical protein